MSTNLQFLATSGLVAVLSALACGSPYADSGARPKNGTAQRDVEDVDGGACVAECQQAYPTASAIEADSSACIATCDDVECVDACSDTAAQRCIDEAPEGECDALGLCRFACP